MVFKRRPPSEPVSKQQPQADAPAPADHSPAAPELMQKLTELAQIDARLANLINNGPASDSTQVLSATLNVLTNIVLRPNPVAPHTGELALLLRDDVLNTLQNLPQGKAPKGKKPTGIA